MVSTYTRFGVRSKVAQSSERIGRRTAVWMPTHSVRSSPIIIRSFIIRNFKALRHARLYLGLICKKIALA